MTGTPVPVFFPRLDVIRSGWTVICEEVLCGVFGAYLKNDAAAIRK